MLNMLQPSSSHQNHADCPSLAKCEAGLHDSDVILGATNEAVHLDGCASPLRLRLRAAYVYNVAPC